MSSHHFVVAAKDTAWHYSFKGAMTGPFASRQEAVQAAIEQAGEEAEPGVEVVVLNTDLKPETVWPQPEAS
ncbi:hypothetical protein SAMN05428969_2071 [Devosia sp. YR412]|uniref:DUF2188 domain-containing protein n=1 Tax=Devosia sp. YR412 TaxID=1881030 RepID=UPI0008B102D7|nr:DUF2188 domain-containing protein [Devosia sp. YR412]SEQ12170.1 hypothetical protein SAMN05428969_2071 [Devosia sp. YR412]